MGETVISILMPCYNRSYDLLRVLRAYDCQTTNAPFEIIAVDDASQDDTFDVLMGYQPSHYVLRPLRMERNRGQGFARNRIIPLVESPLVLFTGDDILPREDFLERHLQAHAYFPEKTAAVLGNISWPRDIPVNTLMEHIDGIGAEQFSYYYLKNGQTYDYRHFYTSNISLKTELLYSVDHWFDPDFTMYGFEDVELGYRLAQNGMKIYYISSAVAYHYHYHSIWSFSERQYKVGLMAHVLTRKHFPIAWFFRKQYYKVLTLLSRSFLLPSTKVTVEWLEMVSLHVLNHYEWRHHRLLDYLYVEVLMYFYYKGLIDAMIRQPKLAQKVHHTHAGTTLLPALKKFAQISEGIELLLGKGDTVLLQNLS